MSINIHGKEYITVAERVQSAHDMQTFQGLDTEVLNDNPVVIKATVSIKIGENIKTFTGISAANPSKAIEKQSPYEVAETSAVGRALGFAGFGIVEGIASADEMVKAGATTEQELLEDDFDVADNAVCPTHKVAMKHYEKDGEEWWSHRLEDGTWCNGKNK